MLRTVRFCAFCAMLPMSGPPMLLPESGSGAPARSEPGAGALAASGDAGNVRLGVGDAGGPASGPRMPPPALVTDDAPLADRPIGAPDGVVW